MTSNPYPKHDGFARRVRRAQTALERFGRDYDARPYNSPGFDNCFEMFDGKAVVWALMHRANRNAAAGDPSLMNGIQRMGAQVWTDWTRLYQPEGPPDLFHCHAAAQQEEAGR